MILQNINANHTEWVWICAGQKQLFGVPPTLQLSFKVCQGSSRVKQMSI